MPLDLVHPKGRTPMMVLWRAPNTSFLPYQKAAKALEHCTEAQKQKQQMVANRVAPGDCRQEEPGEQDREPDHISSQDRPGEDMASEGKIE